MYMCSCAHGIVGTVLPVLTVPYMHNKANSMCAPSHPAQLMRPAAGTTQNTSFTVDNF